MGVIQGFIDGITAWLNGFVPMIIKLFQDFMALFYTVEGGITVFGYLGMMGIAIGLVYLGIRFIRKMFNK